MYNDPIKRRCPKHPTLFIPCQFGCDKSSATAVGGVDWNKESNVSPSINEVAKFAPPKWRGKSRPPQERVDIFTSEDP